MKIAKPNPDEYAPYYNTYISKVTTDDPLKTLKQGEKELLKLIRPLSKKQLKFRYASDKWTIKEILVHLMDAERVFCYRALRFARNDQTKLSGFDENFYTPASKANKRNLKTILKEYRAIRAATIQLFANFTEEMMMRVGTANEQPMSVRALLYVTAGHEIHHLGIIRDRYVVPMAQTT